MNVRLVKKTELINDINEIIELLKEPQFDRKRPWHPTRHYKRHVCGWSCDGCHCFGS